MKRCYKCDKRKPLFLFKKDSSKYQIKSSQGKCICCKKCNVKLALKVGGVMQRIEGKFAFVKLNRIQIIKYFLR
jgi:hypothetical protein